MLLISPNIPLKRARTPKKHPFLIYIVRTCVSSHSIGPAIPQESDVMPCAPLETKSPMCNHDRVTAHTNIAFIGVLYS